MEREKSCQSSQTSTLRPILTSYRYFVLKDFYAIGEDDREKPEIPDFFQVIDEAMGAEQSKVPSPIDDVAHEPIFPITYSNTSPRPRRRLVDERPSSCSSGLPAKTDLKKLSNVEPFSALNEDMPTEPSCSVSSQDRARKRKREIALGEIDPNLSSPPKKIAKTNDEPGKKVSSHNPEEIPAQERVSPGPNSHPNITKEPSDRKRPNAVSTAAPLFTRPVITARKVNQTRVMSAINPVVRIPSNRLVPIERVLSIIPLAKLRGYTRRNDVYDVFVVVYSVGSEVIKRSRMPAKRDLRVIDPSTEKKVLLSIFVDPDKFKPAVGTIALIRSVTTHEWDGGMINVYPKQCEGKQWFLPDPVGIPGCDVAHLRAWWTKKQAEEAKRIHEEKTQE